jgi:(p)ppGpp synthase/HD superfamily hydrolase
MARVAGTLELPMDSATMNNAPHKIAPVNGTPLNGAELVAAAQAIATIAHRGQTDKLGVDYILHPARVAARLKDPAEVAAAWLHDVIEDCDVTREDLLKAGISPEVVDAVVLLTRTPGDKDGPDPDAYYRALRENPIALAVKRADIADNTDPARTALLPEEQRERLRAKYEHALEVLAGRD